MLLAKFILLVALASTVNWHSVTALTDSTWSTKTYVDKDSVTEPSINWTNLVTRADTEVSVSNLSAIMNAATPVINNNNGTTMASVNFTQTVAESSTMGWVQEFQSYQLYQVALWLNKNYQFFIVGFGIPGNLAAIATLLKMRPMTSSAVYMLCLALADTTCIVVKFVYLRMGVLHLNRYDVGCKLLLYTSVWCMHYANWILVAMTIERFIAIWFPLKVADMCTKKKAVLAVLGIGLTLGLIDCHYLVTMREVPAFNNRVECAPHTQYVFWHKNIWPWLDWLIYATIPCCALFVFNSLIIVGIKRAGRVQRRMTRDLKSMVTTSGALPVRGHFVQKTKQEQQQKQVTIMLVTVSVALFVLSMPNVIYYLVKPGWDYMSSAGEAARWYFCYVSVYVCSDLNHAINFYLYFLSGKKFRQQFKELICCCCIRQKALPRCRPRNTTHTNLSNINKTDSRVFATPHKPVDPNYGRFRGIDNLSYDHVKDNHV